MKSKSSVYNSKYKRLIFFVIFAFIFIFPAFNGLKVYNSGGGATATEDYKITSYHVDLQLNQDNVLLIEEQISVFHNIPMQGIIRAIPTFQTVKFKENQKDYKLNYNTKVKPISANTQSSSFVEDGFLFIKLGQAGTFIEGEKLYNIVYEIDLGYDRIEDFDQFYYNIIGNDWDTTISNISFSLTFPKQLQQNSKLTLYAGKHGDVNEQTITVESDLKTFNYSYNGTLNAFEGLTGRIVLPEGYFTVLKPSNLLNYVLIGVFALIIVILLVKIFKNEKHLITPVVMFTSPQNLPPSELGFMLDKKVGNKDISSLIVFWAQKGYLSIHEKNRKYTLVKESDINQDADDYQKDIFNKMFEKSNEIGLDNLGEKIWVEVANAKIKIKNKHYAKNFNKKNITLKDFLAFASVILITAIAVRGCVLNVEPLKRLGVVLLGLLSMLLIFLLLGFQENHFRVSLKTTNNYIFIFLPIISLVFITMMYLSIKLEFIFIILAVLTILLSLLFVIYAYILQIRSQEGTKILGEILGFKQFIILTEKDRIEMLAKENPEMFFNILPYAHVLGVSSVWIKKFEHVAVAQPSWLVSESYGLFDFLVMRSMFNTLFINTDLQTSYASKLSSNNISSSGGFGGGGGFSGGGFGGGGGRGW